MSEIAVPAGTEWTEADFSISGETLADLEAARSANTRDAYRRNWADWLEWCQAEGRVPLPATPHTLLEYIRARKNGTWYPARVTAAGREPKPPSPATLKQVVATIQSAHRGAGYKGQPDAESTRELLKGYGREWADAGNRVRRAAPISPAQLRALVGTCDARTLAGLRDRSLLLVGYAIGRRASTLAGLRIADLRAAGKDGMTIYIRHSKTDQAGNGEEVNVPFGEHQETCAVLATRAWLAALRERGVTGGPLYQRVDAYDRLGCEAGAQGFRGRRGGHIHRTHITNIIRRRHRLAGLPDPEFISGHSLRSGAVTAAHAAGAQPLAIAEQYGFAPLSPVMQLYGRAADRVKNNPAKLMGL